MSSRPSSLPSFGALLRRWREQRRMTQTDLALAADSSTRHLSCLETGKALPSREMIHRLAELLEVPLRERNSLLLAAGFAPAFRESLGMGPKVLNFAAWRAHSLSILRQQIAARADPVLQELFAEVASYPVPEGSDEASFEGAEQLATPLRIATRFGNMRFLSTVTVFGTAQDITLSELALEMLFPADDQTVRIAQRMIDETARQTRAAS